MNNMLRFLLFVSSICVTVVPAVHSTCLEDQRLSLLDFKKGLVFNASLSTKLISWNPSTDCCSWVGVTCSTDGHVLGLDISSDHVSSGIDNSSSLFHLQYLQSLNLADNKLGGGSLSIPSALGKLVDLRYLNLSQTHYSGQIPIEISRLARLVTLDISNFDDLKLESPSLHMLVQNFTELTELYLDYVNISSHGSDWCRALSSSVPKLSVLSMSHCDLSGPFHESLAKLRWLSVIQLEGNNISAPVPAFFSNFSRLTSLNFMNCQLQGTFPKEIFQLPSLQHVDLWNNKQLCGSLPEFPVNASLRSLTLHWTNFSGPLPNSIGNLKNLSFIDILECNFTGSIPKSVANLTKLVYLNMHGNNFEGSIPSFSKAKNLFLVDLSFNSLTGNVSCTHWGNLTDLTILDLSYNMLHGNIPSSLFSIPVLDISHNKFSGHFPEISNVSSHFLESLDLSSNNLEGPIPMTIFKFQGLHSLALSSNNFSGSFPLYDLQQLRNLSKLDLSHNSLFLSHGATNLSYSSFPQFSVLKLASGKLGTFPDFLRNQSRLSDLDLSNNQIHGKIPNWIWNEHLHYLNLSCNSLETLESPPVNPLYLQFLDLHSNKLHGQIPIFQSSFILYLDISMNIFNSSIPDTIGELLMSTRFFSASNNNLSGIIPKSMCYSLDLQVLNLSNNSLSGTVPECLTTMPNLAVLNVMRNNLASIDQLPHNCSLKTLDISGNQIQGQSLKSIANCTKLQVLNIGYNQITDTFPCFLTNLFALRVLILRSNSFYGRIGCPETNGTWPMLHIIDLSHNSFNGEIPGRLLTTWQAMMASKYDSQSKPEYLQYQGYGYEGIYYQDSVTVTTKGFEIQLVKILTVFTSIDFSCNKFNGSIPKEIGELKSLHFLNLSKNAFTGAIPSSLSNSSQLESLDLSTNNLSGEIPPQLTQLTFVATLDLSNNQLVGRIPSGNQFSTYPKASFQGNKGLFGPPLTTDNRPKLSPVVSGRSQPIDSGEEIVWDHIIVEFGFTCGFGIAIGSLLFCKRWRRWYYTAMYNILVVIFPQLQRRFGNQRTDRRNIYKL